MKIFITIFFTVFLLSNICFGQEYIEDENWLKGFKTEADSFQTLQYWKTKRFTVEDVANGKRRLNLIRQFAPQNEWEGIYYAETGIGSDKFIWNAEGGFFRFYFYHTLKTFSFGKIKDSSGFIELEYEKTSLTPINKKNKFIKVKVGEKHFLVPEKRLSDFCERIVGLSTDANDFYYYLTKEDDFKKTAFGLPELPAEYKKYLRYPVEAEIIRVEGKEIITNENDSSYEEVQYTVIINAGKNKKLKNDMELFVKDLGEWIQLTKISQKSSVGFIRRDFDKNNQEECQDIQGEIILCKEIKIGMKAETKSRV